jgi:Zn-dependent protease
LVPAVLLATVLHELAHGVVASWLGDPTARRAGRLTLNPLSHLDPVGTLMLLLVGFGWARPVPVDPRYFRHPYRDMVLVALAGPVTNGLLALVLALAVEALARIVGPGAVATQAVGNAMVLSLSLGIFNLLPVPPLDGAHFLTGLAPRLYGPVVRVGWVLLLVLVLTGAVGKILGPLVLWSANGLLLLAGHAMGAVGR